jgi:hypothetical protein
MNQLCCCRTGLPDFSWYNIPKREEIYQITTNMHQMTVKQTNLNKIFQHLLFQDPPKFTQIGIFCLKICHLATLPP